MKKLFEVTIEITQQCANKCIYCSSWSDFSKTESLDYNTICGIVDDAKELGAKLINISGGEPLLRPDVSDILDYVKSKGLKVRLYTSGILYDNGYMSVPSQVFESLQGKVDTFIVNYEASSPELYAQIMGTIPENELQLDKTIQDAIRFGFDVEAHLVPMKCNFYEIPLTLKKVFSLGVSKVSLLRLVPQGRTVDNEDQTILSKNDEIELKRMLQDLSVRYGNKLRLGKPYRSEKFTTCQTGSIRLAVRYDGFVFPCGAFKDDFMNFEGEMPENIHDKRLVEIYNNSGYIIKVREHLENYYEYEDDVTEPCFGQYCRNK